MASFPGAVKTFVTRNAGDTIQPSHVNDLQDEVNAIEAGYLNGTANLNSSASTVASLSVTGGATFAGVATFLAGLTSTSVSSTRWNSTGAYSAAMNSTVWLTVTAQQIASWPTQPSAGAFNSATQSISSNTQTNVTFLSDDDQMTNIGGMHSTSVNPTRFTVPTGGNGCYALTALITFAATPSGTPLILQFKQNSSLLTPQVQWTSVGTNPYTVSGNLFVNAVAGDYFEVTAYHNAAGSINIGGSATARSQMYVRKVG